MVPKTIHLDRNIAMNLMKFVRNAALVAMLFSGSVANAALLQFTVTGDYTASWQMDSNPTPDVVGDGEGFVVWDVDGFPDAIFGVADITFFNAALGGGLQIYDYWTDFYLLTADGSQLYTGTEDNPLFILGSFALTEYLGTGTYTLTIAQVGGPVLPPVDVPEPATGALLLGGAAIMAGMRKRRNRLAA
jgi:hypothetical protein